MTLAEQITSFKDFSLKGLCIETLKCFYSQDNRHIPKKPLSLLFTNARYIGKNDFNNR